MNLKIKIQLEKELSETERTIIEQAIIMLLNEKKLDYEGNVAFGWKKGKEKK